MAAVTSASAVSSMWMISLATWKTYWWKSRRFFKASRSRFFVVMFLLAPIAAVPDIIPAIFSVPGDASVHPWLRGLDFAAIVATYRTWMASQRPFSPDISRFHVLATCASPWFLRASRAVGAFVASWPVMLLTIGLTVLGDLRAALTALLAVGSAWVAGGARMWWPWQMRFHARHDLRSSERMATVLLRSAGTDMSPARHVGNLVRYASIGGVVAWSMHFAASDDGMAVSTLVLIASGAVAVIPIRGMAEAARERMLGVAPMLAIAPRIEWLCAARVLVGAWFVVAMEVVVVLGAGAGDLPMGAPLLASTMANGLVVCGTRSFGMPKVFDWLGIGAASTGLSWWWP